MTQITIPSNRVSLERFPGTQEITEQPNGDILLKGPCTQYFELTYLATNPKRFIIGDVVYVRIIDVEVPNPEGFINKHAFGNTWKSERSRIRRTGSELSGTYIVDDINGKIVRMTSSGSISGIIAIKSPRLSGLY